MTFIFRVLLGPGIGAGGAVARGKVDPVLFLNISRSVFLLPGIFTIMFLLKRFQNLRRTRWFFSGQFVPFLNLWAQYRIFACPPGYADDKKFDWIGWILGIFYWGLVLLIIAAIAFAVVTLMQGSPEGPYRLAIENFLRAFEKARQTK